MFVRGWFWLFVLVACFAGHSKPIAAESRQINPYEQAVRQIDYGDSEAVIWILDRSPSMSDDIGMLRDRVNNLMQDLQSQGHPVSMGVIAYAKVPQLMLVPTTDNSKVHQAFDKVSPSALGRENAFAACELALSALKRKRNGMIVLLSDEASDDDDKLEKLLKKCQQQKVKVFVMGRQATFGQSHWTWRTNGNQNKTIYNHQEHRGPESWRSETFFDYLLSTRVNYELRESRDWTCPAGYGPWSFARLCQETGGQYIAIPHTDFRTGHNRKKLAAGYAPDLKSPKEQDKSLRKNLKRKLVDDFLKAWSRLPSIERKHNVPRNDMSAVLSTLNKLMPALKGRQSMLEQWIKRFRSLDQDKDKQYFKRPSALRWQANFDLCYGQLLMARTQVEELQRQIKAWQEAGSATATSQEFCGFILGIDRGGGLTRSGGGRNSDYWKDQEIPSEDKLWQNMVDVRRHTPTWPDSQSRWKDQTTAVLEQVIANHPDTPWADMAQKHISRMGGYRLSYYGCGGVEFQDKEQ